MATAVAKKPLRKKKYLRPKCKVVNANAVAVARDVLKHLQFWNLDPGTYCRLDSLASHIPPEDDLHNHANMLTKTCSVCLLGAAFISKVRLFDNCPASVIKDYNGGLLSQVPRWSIVKQLEEIFSEDQVDLMECAFECTPGFSSHPLNNGAAIFGMKAGKKRNRLKKVMENVIINGGEFKPRLATYAEFDNILSGFHHYGT